MFYYVFSIDGRTPDSTTDPDDLRIIRRSDAGFVLHEGSGLSSQSAVQVGLIADD